MSYNSVVIADSPTSYWRLGDTSGTNMADSVGANTGTYRNSPTFSQAGCLTPPGVDTDFSVAFNGTNQDVLLPSLGTFTSFSVEGWSFIQTSTAANFCMFKSANAAGTRACRFMPRSNGYFWGVAPANGTENTNQPTGPSNVDTWIHWVAVYDGTNNKSIVYRNGVVALTNSALAAGSLDMTSATLNSVGSEGGGSNWFCGKLDEISIYPVALSATQAAAHYNAAGHQQMKLNNYLGVSASDTNPGIMSVSEKVR